MAETHKDFDEWKPAHSVARMVSAAADGLSRIWNASQARAKFIVKNEPEVADLGVLAAGNHSLTVNQLKHGFRYEIAAGPAINVVLVLPPIRTMLANGLRIGDVIEFWSLGTIGTPDAPSHTIFYEADAEDTETIYGPGAGNAGEESFAAAENSARRIHVHITGANTLTVIVQS